MNAQPPGAPANAPRGGAQGGFGRGAPRGGRGGQVQRGGRGGNRGGGAGGVPAGGQPPPPVTEAAFNQSLTTLRNSRDPQLPQVTGFTTSSSEQDNVRQLYIWPTIPQSALNPNEATAQRPYDPNSTFRYWSISTSHVHVVLSNAYAVLNGVMTVNLVTGGRQDGTPIWHPKIQAPPVQPRDLASVSETLAGRGMASFQHPPGDPQNRELQEVNEFLPVFALGPVGMPNIMIERILMDAVQFHILRDGDPAPWKNLVLPNTRRWSPRGERYKDEWQGLMRAVNRMCTEWWGADYRFPFARTFVPPGWRPLAPNAPIVPPRQPGQQQGGGQEEGNPEEDFPALGGPGPAPRAGGVVRGRGGPRGRGGTTGPQEQAPEEDFPGLGGTGPVTRGRGGPRGRGTPRGRGGAPPAQQQQGPGEESPALGS